MSNSILNKTVSSQEAEALKEMIFKRARERAEALAKDVQEDYTSNIQNDVMDLARNSFTSNKNPFAIKEYPKEESIVENNFNQKEDNKQYEIGFQQRSLSEIKAQIHYRNKEITETNTHKEIAETMNVARSEFINKKSFTGALEFLNSQASIALIKNKGQAFEALA